MRAVAVRRIVTRLAATQIGHARRLGNKPDRFNPRTLMRTVAKRLTLRTAARAPEICPPFGQLDLIRPRLSHNRIIGHSSPLIIFALQLLWRTCAELDNNASRSNIGRTHGRNLRPQMASAFSSFERAEGGLATRRSATSGSPERGPFICRPRAPVPGAGCGRLRAAGLWSPPPVTGGGGRKPKTSLSPGQRTRA